jgi:hypothetical protein
MVQGRHCSALGSVTLSRELIRVFFLFFGGGWAFVLSAAKQEAFFLGAEIPPAAGTRTHSTCNCSVRGHPSRKLACCSILNLHGAAAVLGT